MAERIVTPIDLAYAAGLIDGEGTIGITELKPSPRGRSDGRALRKNPSHRIYVAISMTDRVAVQWMHEVFGGNFQTVKPAQPQHKQSFRWSLGSQRAAEFCELIRPYLKIKGPQAGISAKFYSECLGRKFQGSVGLPDDELAKRRKLLAEVKALNRRGTAAAA